MPATVLHIGDDWGSDPDVTYTESQATSPSFSTGSASMDTSESSFAAFSDVAVAWWTLHVSRRSEARYLQMILDTLGFPTKVYSQEDEAALAASASRAAAATLSWATR